MAELSKTSEILLGKSEWNSLVSAGRPSRPTQAYIARLLLVAERLGSRTCREFVDELFHQLLNANSNRYEEGDSDLVFLLFADYYLRIQAYQHCFSALDRAHSANPKSIVVWNSLALLFLETGRLNNVLKCIAKISELGAEVSPALATRTHSRLLRLVDVDVSYERYKSSASHQNINTSLLTPLEILYLEDRQGFVVCATKKWVDQRLSDDFHTLPSPKPSYQRPFSRSTKRKIGYLSGDFCDHAMGMLLLPLLSNHTQHDFEVVCFYSGVIRDKFTQEFVRLASDFVEVGSLNAAELNALLVAHELDALVDLSGHTKHSRSLDITSSVASHVYSYLGYPGPILTPVHTATIGDRVIFESDGEFGEPTIKLPVCYQPYGSERWFGVDFEAILSAPKETVGLEMRLINLGNYQKITSKTINVWSRVLASHPRSTLTLLVPQFARENIGREFSVRGVQPERLRFLERLEKTAYLKELRHASIYLDTFPYGSHTTCADALSVELPYVSMYGETFASKVGKSILSHIGIPDWAAPTEESYCAAVDQIASDLGNASERLREAKLSPYFMGKTTANALENVFRDLH